MRHRYFRYEQIAAQWRTVDPYPLIVGGFQLDHLYRCFTEFGADIEPRTREDEPVDYLEVFAQVPRRGSGQMTGVQVMPGADDHTIWHYDMRRGTVPLDVDYAGYGEDLRVMLEIFPEIFPGHDYTPLTERLAERL